MGQLSTGSGTTSWLWIRCSLSWRLRPLTSGWVGPTPTDLHPTPVEGRVGEATEWGMTSTPTVSTDFISGQVRCNALNKVGCLQIVVRPTLSITLPCMHVSTNETNVFLDCVGCIPRTVNSPKQHILRAEDVVSCCLDLSVPSISFRINGQPVQGMFENFNSDGLFFPVASFSAGVKSVLFKTNLSV